MGIGTKVARLWQLRTILWTLVVRDLRVRYARSWLGYLWTVLDPLAMAAIYFVVFAFIFDRGDIGHRPYFIFLLVGLLAWQWVSGSVNSTALAILSEAKLVRSTNLPREIWVLRIVIAKGIEFLLSLPILVGFSVYYLVKGQLHLNARLLFFPLGVVLLFVFLVGAGLLLAPVTALVTDTQRVVRILLRMGFYFTPVIYAVHHVPEPWRSAMWVNPLAGITELLRAGFFDAPLDTASVVGAVVVTVVTLGAGIATFARLERAVLKEI
ncbi:MAG: ABC transporter permease [Tetrasphaera sp.]|nr:ABC transporter permease [Tetrasphaera sp.]